MTADRFKYSNYSGTEGQRHNGTKQNKVSTQAQRGKCTEAHRFLPDLQISICFYFILKNLVLWARSELSGFAWRNAARV